MPDAVLDRSRPPTPTLSRGRAAVVAALITLFAVVAILSWRGPGVADGAPGTPSDSSVTSIES